MGLFKDKNRNDETSFGPFVSSSKTPTGALILNQFDSILDNIIQPLINQSKEITYRDIEDLVTNAKIEKLEEI